MEGLDTNTAPSTGYIAPGQTKPVSHPQTRKIKKKTTGHVEICGVIVEFWLNHSGKRLVGVMVACGMIK